MTIIPSKEFVDLFKSTPGALSVCESIAIINLAATAPNGVYMECGSHAGKSGMSAAYSLPSYKLTEQEVTTLVGMGHKFSEGSTLYAPLPYYLIDPCFDLKNLEAWKHTIQEHPDNIGWPHVTKNDFNEKVKERITAASGGKITPVLMGDYSENVLPKFEGYGWVFIDSDNHQHERVFGEINMIKDKMVQGGIIAFHDFGNQYISPQEAHAYLIGTGEFENIPIDWTSIFNYVRENKLEEGNDSWHEKGSEEFPKFVGAVRRK